MAKSCTWCGTPLPKKADATPGRSKLYCSDAHQKLGWQARKRDRAERDIEVSMQSIAEAMELAEPTRDARPVEWWVAQAHQVSGACARCGGMLVGVYAPPTTTSMGECAVIEHCRLCGRERVLLSGYGGAPYGPDATPAAPRTGRPARVAGGQGKGRGNKTRWRERDAQRTEQGWVRPGRKQPREGAQEPSGEDFEHGDEAGVG